MLSRPPGALRGGQPGGLSLFQSFKCESEDIAHCIAHDVEGKGVQTITNCKQGDIESLALECLIVSQHLLNEFTEFGGRIHFVTVCFLKI